MNEIFTRKNKQKIKQHDKEEKKTIKAKSNFGKFWAHVELLEGRTIHNTARYISRERSGTINWNQKTQFQSKLWEKECKKGRRKINNRWTERPHGWEIYPKKKKKKLQRKGWKTETKKKKINTKRTYTYTLQNKPTNSTEHMAQSSGAVEYTDCISTEG